MKNVLVILLSVVCCCGPAFAAWTPVQATSTPTNTTCGTSATSCTQAITTVGTGHLLGISFGCDSTVFSGPCTMTGATSNIGATVVDTFSTPVCGFDSTRGRNVCAAYVLSSAGGATSIVVARTVALGYNWQFTLYEESTSAPPAILDASGTIDDSTSMSNQPGVALTLTGGNDAIIQAMDSIGTGIGITNPYTTQTFVGHYASGLAVNTASGLAPTFNWSITGTAAGVALAFKESAAAPALGAALVVSGGMIASGGLIAATPQQVIAITSTSPLPNCVITIPFSFTFNAIGGFPPYTWSLFSGTLQPGLSLSSAGVLSGTCTFSSGTDVFTVQVKDTVNNATTAVFQQTAQNTPPNPLLICFVGGTCVGPNPPTPGITGTFYTYGFAASGGTAPYTWTIIGGALPNGLALASGGALTGFPTAAGVFNFTVQVTDSTSPTPLTASQAFSVTIIGANGAPQTAVEPQTWTTAYQGGQNLTTGNPCQPTDAAGACARNLPKTCNAANHCIHEQLGFGSNDHPASIAGLYAANCDWTGALGTDSGQNWYMWVEVKNTVLADLNFTTVYTANYRALYNAPVKINGIHSPAYNGTTCTTAANNTPIGPYSLAGTVTGSYKLGESVTQQVTGASASVVFVTCNNGVPPNMANILPNCAPTALDPSDFQVGPISVSQIIGTADGNASHLWVGSQTGATLAPSAVPFANGYFRLTGQCSPGAGSGSPLTPGYPVGTNDTPCNNLPDRIPCYHSALDSALVFHPLCDNDLPSMFTIEATFLSVNSTVMIEQDGDNTSLSGFEATFWQGQNQSLGAPLTCNSCQAGGPAPWNNFPQSGLSPEIMVANCGNCGRDHYWIHGWDAGDPSIHAGDPSQLSIASGTCGTLTPCYPNTPGTSQYNCPGWAYFQTNPGSLANAPVNLASYNYGQAGFPFVNLTQYENGCGDDIIWAVSVANGGNDWDEYFTINKIHKYSAESHTFQIGNAATNLNPNGAGFNCMYKLTHFLTSGSAESGLFIGGTPVNPVSNVACDMEFRGFRTMIDPGYRYLTGNSGHSPAASGGYGCGAGTSSSAPQLCPVAWAVKKGFEIKWCLRCFLDGFVGENVWPDGQTGENYTADVRVCSGGDDCGIFNPDGSPMTVANDIRATNGIIRNSSGGFTLAPRSGGPGDGGGVGAGMNRVFFQHLAFINLDQNQFGGSKGGEALIYGAAGNKFPGCTGVRALVSSVWTDTVSCPIAAVTPNPLSEIDLGVIAGAPQSAAGTMYVNFNGQREDPINGGYSQFSCQGGGDTCLCPTLPCVSGTGGALFKTMIDLGYDCTVLPCTPADGAAGHYSPGTWKPQCGSSPTYLVVGSACQNCGVSGSSQCPPFGCGDVGCATGTNLTMPAVQVCKGPTKPLPGCGLPNNTFQSLAFSILDIAPGDMVFVTNCVDPTFNAPVGGAPSVANSYASANQQVNSLSVIYPSPGNPPVTGNATTSGCQVNNSGGFAKNFIGDHLGLYTGAQSRLDATEYGFYTQMLNNQLTNSIFDFGGNLTGTGIFCVSGTNCAGKEAVNAPYQTFDQVSNQIHHNIFVLPTTARATLYSAVGFSGSPFCVGGLNGGGNCVPATVGCATTQTLDGNGNPICVGLQGFLTGTTSFPNTDCTSSTLSACPLVSPPWGTFDYHSLQLCTSCYAGGANFWNTKATDGTAVGPSFTAIDNAITRTLYICTGPCGTGPWPD